MILIDYREDERLVKEFKPYGDTPVVSDAVLPYGDIAFVGNGPEEPVAIGFERKTIHNLCSSIRSEQLGGFQLLGMIETYPYAAYLLIEGIWQAGPNGEVQVRAGKEWVPLTVGTKNFHFREVDHFVATMEEAGLRIIRTSSMTETAATVVSRYKWWNDKEYKQHKAHRGIYAPVPMNPARNGGNKYRFIRPEKPSLVVKMTSQIPGIDEKAWKVGEYFKGPPLQMCCPACYLQHDSKEHRPLAEQEWREALGLKKGEVTVGKIIKELWG